jgi:phytoene/squalene synthetase
VISGAPPLTLPLPGGLVVRRPALFDPSPLDRSTALGVLFDPSWRDETRRPAARATRRLLGPLGPAFDLLPSLERRRAATLAVWIESLFANAREGDRVDRRIERLHRSAFTLARALAGERSAAPFAQRFADEARRRSFPRHSLDGLLAEARAAIRQPIASTPEEWEIRSRALSAVIAEALVGEMPSPATIEAANAFVRLIRLTRIPVDSAAGFHLPVESPPTFSGAPPREAMIAAISEECEEIHRMALRGARALGEVPLTYRTTLSAMLALGLRLLGKIEAHPGAFLEGRVRLGRVERAWTVWRSRRERFS